MRKLIALGLGLALLASCGGGDGSSPNYGNEDYVKNLPSQALDSNEIASINFVREEEKLARDTYRYLATPYSPQTNTFSNITVSEQRHMDMVKTLIDKYNLSDPVEQTGDRDGVFVDQTLQTLYNQLTSCGDKGIKQALSVGGYVEEVDIIDLTNRMDSTDNEDIKYVFKQLRKGSFNHLKAFSEAYKNITGTDYRPQILCDEDYNSILSLMQAGQSVEDYNLKCDYSQTDLGFSCPE